MRTTLFVAGFGTRTRARELAYEFERYGRLIRCDIPAAKSYTAKPYAFIEYEDPHDAEDAFNEMHGRSVDGYIISVQWARNAPSAKWRLDGPTTTPNPPPLPPHGSLRRRSMSPPHSHPSLSRGIGQSPPPSKRYSFNSERSRSRSPPPLRHEPHKYTSSSSSTSPLYHHHYQHHQNHSISIHNNNNEKTKLPS